MVFCPLNEVKVLFPPRSGVGHDPIDNLYHRPVDGYVFGLKRLSYIVVGVLDGV